MAMLGGRNGHATGDRVSILAQPEGRALHSASVTATDLTIRWCPKSVLVNLWSYRQAQNRFVISGIVGSAVIPESFIRE